MLRGKSEESTCQLQRFFSTIRSRGFYVLILNQWYLISNNHEKSRIQVATPVNTATGVEFGKNQYLLLLNGKFVF